MTIKHSIHKLHFIGIGGTGMSPIAEIFHNMGYKVSGSDIAQSYNTEHLAQLGIEVFIGHSAHNLKNTDVVVTSSAIDDTNPELLYANLHKLPVMTRAMMLAELMRFKYGIAIAGTHGKTTTTSMCAEVFQECKFDPTWIIGGKLESSGSNAKNGSGQYLIAEADESDASFLCLNPMITVVTNIDLDHMETYSYDEIQLQQAFIDFIHKLPFYGKAIVCGDDDRTAKIIPHLKRHVITYGTSNKHDIYATNIACRDYQMHFTVHIKELNIEHKVILNALGIHNVLNSLAVMAVALACNGNIEDILNGLNKFHGTGRRCQKYSNLEINQKSVTLIDDYGHHPNEIKATLLGIFAAYSNKRIILVFQPHRYTRTRDLFDQFIEALSLVENVIIMDVYSAGEEPIDNADALTLINTLKTLKRNNISYAPDLQHAYDSLCSIVQDNDLIVTMGAGSIGKLPNMFQEKEII